MLAKKKTQVLLHPAPPCLFLPLLLLLLAAGPLVKTAAESDGQGGPSVGGGISVFVPQSLYQGRSGSVSKEAGLSTSLGLGNYLSLPVGFTYLKANGFTADGITGSGGGEDLNMWFSADTFLPYLRAKASLPLGIFYAEVQGGITGAWIVAPQPFIRTIENHYSTPETRYVFDQISMDPVWGWGWQAGASAGIRIDAISVGVDLLYTSIRADMNLSSDTYWAVDRDTPGSTAQETDFDFGEDLQARLRGFSIGLSGKFAF